MWKSMLAPWGEGGGGGDGAQVPVAGEGAGEGVVRDVVVGLDRDQAGQTRAGTADGVEDVRNGR